MSDGGGGGGGESRKRLPTANPTILKNCQNCSPTSAASDWCGVGSVDYLALETSIKQGMLRLHASQIRSHLICGRTYYRWFGLIFI